MPWQFWRREGCIIASRRRFASARLVHDFKDAMSGCCKSILLFLIFIFPTCKGDISTAIFAASSPTQTGASVIQSTYHGWPGSFLISNGKVEVAVVGVTSGEIRLGPRRNLNG